MSILTLIVILAAIGVHHVAYQTPTCQCRNHSRKFSTSS